MDNRNNQPRVRSIFAYLKDSLKFYDMDHPSVPRIIFILQLAIVFGGYIFARPYVQKFFIYFEQFNTKLQGELSSKNFDMSFITSETYIRMSEALFGSLISVVLIVIAIKSVSFLIGLFYGTYYYYSQTNPMMKGTERAMVYFKRLPKIIVFNILFYCAFYFGAMLFALLSVLIITIIPLFAALVMLLPLAILALNTLFIFKDLLIIEFDVKLFRNFKKTLDITKGCRKNVILNGLWPLCIGWLVSAFAVDIQNPVLSLFIASFIEVIILLISQRLTALMFIDAASIERHGTRAVQETVQKM